MTPGAGFLDLGHGHISHIVRMYYFFKILLLYPQAQTRQTYYIVIMTKVESTKIINFMTQWSRGSCAIVKMHYFFRNFPLYSQEQIRQTKKIVGMTQEESTIIINFMTLLAGVHVLGCDHISHLVKMHYFLKIIFSTPRHRSDKQSMYSCSNDNQGKV